METMDLTEAYLNGTLTPEDYVRQTDARFKAWRQTSPEDEMSISDVVQDNLSELASCVKSLVSKVVSKVSKGTRSE